MPGIPSPDIPAYYCYAIVFVVGGLVAWSKVKNLANFPDRWAFAATWQLFLAHLLLPVALFWFLDYLSVIQDTSLFAAFVVGAGYGQIFSGSVEGIALPGQAASLWSPFQAWVKTVADRIATKQKEYRDQFAHRTQLAVSRSDDLRALMESLVDEEAPAPVSTTDDYKKLSPIQKVRVLWKELRTTEPVDYGYLLYHKKIIFPFSYWWWLKKGRAQTVTAVTLGVTFIALLVLWSQVIPGPNIVVGNLSLRASSTTGDLSNVVCRYYQWRATKPNASKWDQFRTERYFHRILDGDQASEAERAGHLIVPIRGRLCFSDVASQQTDYIVRVLVGLHSKVFDRAIVPQLLNCLRTSNATVRFQIHQTLLDLRNADYLSANKSLPSELLTWIPKQDEAAGTIETCVQAWNAWWNNQWGVADVSKAVCEGNHIPVGGEAHAEDSGRADNTLAPPNPPKH